MGLERLNLWLVRSRPLSPVAVYPLLTMLTTLLFDLDGTLANTDPVHYQVWQDLLKDYGIMIDPPFYRRYFSGRRNPEIIVDVLPHLSPAEGEALGDRKEAEFRRRVNELPSMPGLWELLRWMDEQQLKRAIVTNAPRENADFMITALQVGTVFPVVVLGDELERGKPDPLPYQAALAQLNSSPDEAVVFEDSSSGIRAAVAAQIPTVGIASTHTVDELYDLGATLVVADFTDPALWQFLQQRQRQPIPHR